VKGSSKRALIKSAGVRDDLLAAKEASGASCARARFRDILAIKLLILTIRLSMIMMFQGKIQDSG
jgi:hypothetical protein